MSTPDHYRRCLLGLPKLDSIHYRAKIIPAIATEVGHSEDVTVGDAINSIGIVLPRLHRFDSEDGLSREQVFHQSFKGLDCGLILADLLRIVVEDG